MVLTYVRRHPPQVVRSLPLLSHTHWHTSRHFLSSPPDRVGEKRDWATTSFCEYPTSVRRHPLQAVRSGFTVHGLGLGVCETNFRPRKLVSGIVRDGFATDRATTGIPGGILTQIGWNIRRTLRHTRSNKFYPKSDRMSVVVLSCLRPPRPAANVLLNHPPSLLGAANESLTDQLSLPTTAPPSLLESHLETLMIDKINSRKFTTQNDLCK